MKKKMKHTRRKRGRKSVNYYFSNLFLLFHFYDFALWNFSSNRILLSQILWKIQRKIQRKIFKEDEILGKFIGALEGGFGSQNKQTTKKKEKQSKTNISKLQNLHLSWSSVISSDVVQRKAPLSRSTATHSKKKKAKSKKANYQQMTALWIGNLRRKSVKNNNNKTRKIYRRTLHILKTLEQQLR